MSDDSRSMETGVAQIERENVRITVDAGIPALEFPGGKIHLRFFGTHDRFSSETIEPDELEVETEHVADGTIWHIKSPGENMLNFSIEPELVE